MVNELMKRGCEVVYERMYDVHVSGHACQEELKIIHGLTRPKYFIPVHGEQKHLQKHAALARSMGMPAQNVLIGDIGKVVEITPDKMEVVGRCRPAGCWWTASAWATWGALCSATASIWLRTA